MGIVKILMSLPRQNAYLTLLESNDFLYVSFMNKLCTFEKILLILFIDFL